MSEIDRIEQETQEAEARKREKEAARQAKFKAKRDQARGKLISKLVAPVLLVLTIFIAMLLMWLARR